LKSRFCKGDWLLGRAVVVTTQVDIVL
jgi:hypothetical protein